MKEKKKLKEMGTKEKISRVRVRVAKSSCRFKNTALVGRKIWGNPGKQIWGNFLK